MEEKKEVREIGSDMAAGINLLELSDRINRDKFVGIMLGLCVALAAIVGMMVSLGSL